VQEVDGFPRRGSKGEIMYERIIEEIRLMMLNDFGLIKALVNVEVSARQVNGPFLVAVKYRGNHPDIDMGPIISISNNRNCSDFIIAVVDVEGRVVWCNGHHVSDRRHIDDVAECQWSCGTGRKLCDGCADLRVVAAAGRLEEFLSHEDEMREMPREMVQRYLMKRGIDVEPLIKSIRADGNGETPWITRYA
jgi:hypothetical protein